MAKQQTNRPAFSAPLMAFLRQGHGEIGQALPAFPDSMRCVDEPGTLGNPTMQMVTAEIGTLSGYDRMLDEYASDKSRETERDREMER